jgi:hypothetical protein
MNLELDDEALDMINDFKIYEGDESYAIHLAYKILELYVGQV